MELKNSSDNEHITDAIMHFTERAFHDCMISLLHDCRLVLFSYVKYLCGLVKTPKFTDKQHNLFQWYLSHCTSFKRAIHQKIKNK